MTTPCRLLTAFASLLLFQAQAAFAAVEFQLLNHPNGAAQNPSQPGDEYGLRIDNRQGVQTFSFDPGVKLSFDPNSPQEAFITGKVKHIQSGQHWGLQANLRTVYVSNADSSDWRTDTSSPDRLYNGIIEDFQTFGTNAFGVPSSDLKAKIPAPAIPTDRLGFELVDVTLTFMDGPANPVFRLRNNSHHPNIINLDEFPNDTRNTDTVPFLLSKGHRLDSTTDQLVGIGWLQPAEDRRPKYTQDFLFVVGPPMPDTSQAPVPEPTSLLAWTILGLCGYQSTARRKLRLRESCIS